MFSAMRLDYVACIKPKVLACGVRTKGPILGAGALALTLFSGSAAQAQCTVSGLTDLSKVAGGVVANAGLMAVTNVSASVGALVSSINTVNTAFLTQSSAFIGSPANPRPDQEGGGVWARGVGGHLSVSTTATAGSISFDKPYTGGSITFHKHTLEDFAGVQIGTDFARLDVNGGDFHLGSTVGYLGSKKHHATPRLSPPPRFCDSLQI